MLYTSNLIILNKTELQHRETNRDNIAWTPELLIMAKQKKYFKVLNTFFSYCK